MHNLILNLSLSDDEVAVFQDRNAMVVALSDNETAMLRNNVIGVQDFLAQNLKCLSTLQQILESTGDKEAQIAKTLNMLMEPARSALHLHGQSRELLGRAVFVGPHSVKKGRTP